MHLESLIAVTTIAAVSTSAILADRPTADAKRMVEIVEQLEKQGYGPFSEVDFDDGHWEVEVYKNEAVYELVVDRRSGTILAEHLDDSSARPPREAQPLSQILRGLSKAGYADIHEVSFEHRYWEIEAFRKDGQHELHVQPSTGEVISDRRDD